MKKYAHFNEETKISPEDMSNLPHLERYDEAVTQLIRQIFAGQVVFAPDGNAKEYAIKQRDYEEKSLEFPFISLYPDINYEITNNSFAQYQVGMAMQNKASVYDINTNQYKGDTSYVSKNVQHLYIDIDYQVDIWSLSRGEGLQVVQELLFWLYNQQEVKIKYYNEEFILSLVPPESFTDNSDLLQVETEGKLYRYTLVLTVHAAIYRSKNYFNVLEQVIELDKSENDKEEK